MLPAIGLALGLAGGIGKIFGRKKANKELDKLNAANPVYSANPIAAQRLGLAKQLLNARMPGAVAAERNIASNFANQVNDIKTLATDGSQALAAVAAAGGNSNAAYNQLATQEEMDYQRRADNLEGAQEGMIHEDDKVFGDQTRRWQDEVNIKGAQQANNQNTMGDISNLGFGLMDFGLSGGFNNLFKKKNRNQGGGLGGTMGGLIGG